MAEKQTLNTRAAGVVGLAVMCSRVLGLVREQLFAALFGGGRAMDAFGVAFRLPNLLRDMFAEGALSTAFITTFSKKIAAEGDESAWALARKMATLTAVFLSLVTLIGMFLTPYIVAVLAPGFDADKAALTVWLARIMYPFILLVSLAALVMGMLNAKNIFGIPAMASSFFNIGSILGGAGIGWWLDPEFGQRALTGLAIGTVIGGALQLFVQIPALFKIGFRFRPDFHWSDPGVKQILRLMGPAVLAAGSVQINVMINTMFASKLADGSIFQLGIAFRLMQLPLGIFGVAIGTVTLPVLARSAAAKNTEEFRTILAKGIRLAMLLTLPATVGLMFLAEPILSVLYQHGKFDAQQTALAAAALQSYAIGLSAYACMKVLAPAFYAIDKRRTPMFVSFGAIGLNLLLNYLFTIKFGFGIRGLAFSTGCVAITNFGLLYFLMKRETRLLDTRLLVGTLLKLLLPLLALAGVCMAGNHWLLADWATMPILWKIAALFGTIIVATALFAGCAALMRIEEMNDLVALVKRKLRR